MEVKGNILECVQVSVMRQGWTQCIYRDVCLGSKGCSAVSWSCSLTCTSGTGVEKKEKSDILSKKEALNCSLVLK